MPSTDTAVGDRFARRLLAKDWDGLASTLATDVDFRGLTPGRFWEATTSTSVIEVFTKWFEPSDDIYQVIDVATDRVIDRGRVIYRARIRNPDGEFLCEQTAYFDTADDRIVKLRILCSGFQPVA